MGEPHQHSWFECTRADEHGAQILDCACGERIRIWRNAVGLPERAESALRPGGAIANVLHDCAQLNRSDFKQFEQHQSPLCR